MINQGKISILQNIIIDNDLPKYKKVKENTTVRALNDFDAVGDIDADNFNDEISAIGSNRITIPTTGPRVRTSDQNLDYLEYLYANTHSMIIKFKMWLYKKLFFKVFDLDRKKNFLSKI